MSLQDELQEQLDVFLSSFNAQWESPMVFPLHIGPDCATSTTTYNVDICKFLSGQPIPDAPITLACDFAYFCRETFPPPNDPNTRNPFASLRVALEAAAIKSGFELISQGAAKAKGSLQKRRHPANSCPPFASIRFTCNRYRTFQQKKRPATESIENATSYRKVSLHNDNKINSRGSGGLKGPRKGTSQKSLSSNTTCPFTFAVYLDKCGFLLKKGSLGSTSTCHNNHMRRVSSDIPSKIKQLTDAMRLQCGQLANAFARPSAARNFINTNYNFNLTTQQVRFAMKKFTANGTFNINGEDMAADGVVTWLRTHKDELNYCIWGAVPEPEIQEHTAEQAAIIFDRQFPVEFNEFSSVGMSGVDDLSDLCHETSAGHQAEIRDLNLSDSQNLFVACAWSTHQERRAFILSPDVIKLDVTESTNMEKRPLLTVSIRSAFGHYIVIARMFLSHQRRVSFCWAFSIALPRLLGERYICLVKTVMTDGDSNEILEMEEAISRWMPQAFRLRCAWHIIFKGWQRNCSGLLHTTEKKNKKKFQLIAATIKKWCYTFCWPGFCESKEELQISKCLLLAFIHSRRPNFRFVGREDEDKEYSQP